MMYLINGKLVENVRQETLDGREYVVAPVVLLTEGVHCGSAGCLYYPAVELERSAERWNGVELPVYHPEGETARTPQVIAQQSVGRLFGVQYLASPTPRLRGELWVDKVKAERVHPGLVDAIVQQSHVEVSTGLEGDPIGGPGAWRGERYIAAVGNYQPDHLALLPGQRGACSGADGCGVWMNDDGAIDNKLGGALRTIANAFGLLPNGGAGQGVARGEDEKEDGMDTEPGKAGAGSAENEERCTCGAAKNQDDNAAGREDSLGAGDEAQKEGVAATGTKDVRPEGDGEEQKAPEQDSESVTTEDYVAQAPQAVREVLEESLAANAAEKDRLVRAILDNKRNAFAENDLRAMPIASLRNIMAISDGGVDYSGAASAPVTSANAGGSKPAKGMPNYLNQEATAKRLGLKEMSNG